MDKIIKKNHRSLSTKLKYMLRYGYDTALIRRYGKILKFKIRWLQCENIIKEFPIFRTSSHCLTSVQWSKQNAYMSVTVQSGST